MALKNEQCERADVKYNTVNNDSNTSLLINRGGSKGSKNRV